jgi:hypothetical protein
MINIIFKPEELDLVLQALSQQPYRAVVSLIENLLKQAREQDPKQQDAPK